MQDKVTFKNLFKYARVVASSFPVLSVVGKHTYGELFPPMGDNAAMWRCAASLILALLVLLPLESLPAKVKPWIIVGLCVLCLGTTVRYIRVAPLLLVEISYPQEKKQFVIKGTEKNPTLDKDLAGKSDHELIEDYGQDDSGLEDVYTKESLNANRQRLFWLYVSSLGLLQLILGVVEKRDLPATLKP